MATPISAANAYSALARIADVATGGGAASKAAATEGGGGFGDMLKAALGSVVDSGQKTDQQSKALAGGKADIVNVVTAVAETEVAIDAVVSVRDRVIQAYEEILRMPI